MKMVSTSEMVAYLDLKALPAQDERFISHLRHMDKIGQITAISDEDILHLDAIYHQYKEKQ